MIPTSRLIVHLSCLAINFILLADAALPQARSQDSAPSSHLVFDDNFDGDILINEVRVPKSGEATYTYYEALGWRGRGAGYAGIQAHPKAHLFLFSIWDHKEHTAPIKAVHRGPGTETVGFGGEGTGLKSWNFELGWKTDVWYTLVARSWPVGDHTHYGFWSRAGDSGRWTHLVTMDVAAKATFQGGTDAFIEDWLNTGAKPRSTHLRGGWKRKLDGTWFPFGSGRYSVNSWDLEPGKRSFNFRSNWNGGVARDETGEFYFMVSGGADTKSEATNPSKFAIARMEKQPSYAPLKLRSAKCELSADQKSLAVSWDIDETTSPQFGVEVQFFDNADGLGNALAQTSIHVPHARSATLTIPPLNLKTGRYVVSLQAIDLFDRQPPAMLIELSSTRDK